MSNNYFQVLNNNYCFDFIIQTLKKCRLRLFNEIIKVIRANFFANVASSIYINTVCRVYALSYVSRFIIRFWSKLAIYLL